jgi:hypothetical protein
VEKVVANTVHRMCSTGTHDFSIIFKHLYKVLPIFERLCMVLQGLAIHLSFEKKIEKKFLNKKLNAIAL